MRTLKIFYAPILALLFLAACSDDDDAGTDDVDAVATCEDGIMNGNETGVDCGGDCAACEVEPTCDDGIQNGEETGVDCGGSCEPCDTGAGFLVSQLDALGEIDLGEFVIPDFYDIEGVFAPGAYNGQIRRIAQLDQIKDVLRDQPIEWDLGEALSNGEYELFTGDAFNASANIRSKIDELSLDIGNTGIADDFEELADILVASSVANTGDASNGTAGILDNRHFSENGLEYAQILEKGLYGALCYDQMVDDYLRLTQAGPDNPLGNNQAAVDNYASNGTDRQHRWDEAFGWLGANPDTYPNPENTSNGDGLFIANYTFDFSDETEDAYGINLAEKAMRAFIVGRAALKAGEGVTSSDETEYADVFNAARADAKLYVESGLAAAAFHYLNLSIADVTDADKLHHLSEALAFIYALSFNSEGRLTLTEAQSVLAALGWTTLLDESSDMISLDNIYELNLYEVTDEEMEAAKTILDESFPGFINVPF
ncbi:MAG: DUF4856 domain-containing protein [Bacteroidota bacterium]